jgi:peptidoglycan hydrolase-like protein with peptidoglycan-binding domain
MQPKLLLSSTFALVMGLTGVAYAGGAGHAPRDNEKEVHIDSQTTKSSPSKTHGHAVMTREQTREMQRALTARNLYQGEIDGVWGAKTESALRNFQTQSGLEATGEMNDSTAQALGLDMSRSGTAPNERQTVSGTDNAVQTAPPTTGTAPPTTGTATPHAQANLEDGRTNVQLSSLSQEQGREMQQRLQLLGYYNGPVDGKIGEGTRNALNRYFQRQAELARQGVISNATIGMFGTNVADVRTP